MAEAQEPFQVFALEGLGPGLQINEQLLAVVVVVHALGHVHLKPAQGIAEAAHQGQVHEDVVADRAAQVAGQFRLHGLRTAQAVEGIDLQGPVAGRVDIGVPWHLGDLGDSVLDAHRGHHIGIRAHVGAHHQQVLVARPHPGAEGVE